MQGNGEQVKEMVAVSHRPPMSEYGKTLLDTMVAVNAHEASLARQGWKLTEGENGEREWIAPDEIATVADGQPVTRREIDAFLDGLDVRCAKGIHPLHAIQVRGGVEKCMACGRRVDR